MVEAVYDELVDLWLVFNGPADDLKATILSARIDVDLTAEIVIQADRVPVIISQLVNAFLGGFY